ncbi:DUF4252 domain-containing protein [Flavobacteriaceae bacterium F08102]|nr:DUF4252 domain-containing protein [Flavobacteriaceae bacterium F08102]
MNTSLKKMVLLLCAVTLVSCASNLSLQKYYIDNSDNENFITLDIPGNVFALKENAPTELSKITTSIHKFNILAFIKKEDNKAQYAIENQKVKAILKNDKYQELIRIKHQGRTVSLKYEGEEDDQTLHEVVLFASDKEKGFALVRILGENMNPADMIQFAKNFDAVDLNGTELEGVLQNIEKNVVQQD